MLVGLVSGTYSSVFIAAQLLVSWDEGDFSRLFSRGGPSEPEVSQSEATV
jgi:preprotein translocase subunit SecF